MKALYLLLLIIVFGSCNQNPNQKTENNTATVEQQEKEKSSIQVFSTVLAKEFDTDAVLAHNKYKGQRLIITNLLVENIGENSSHERTISCSPINIDKGIIYTEFGGDNFTLQGKKMKNFIQAFYIMGIVQDPSSTVGLKTQDGNDYLSVISIEGNYVDYKKDYCQTCALAGAAFNGGSITAFEIYLSDCKITKEK